jgi:hypothetical protein
MWNRLTLQYAETSAANASLLLGKFHQYKMDPDHSIMAHINRLRMMADELKSVGTAIDDLTVMVRIIQTLPPSYRYFISAWESVPRSEQTLTSLTARLITEEIRGKTYGVDPADTAFFASHPSRVQQRSEANAAQSKAADRNYSPDGHQQYRRGQSNQRRGRANHHRDNFNSNRRDNGRDGNRGCWHCGRSNHKSYNCWFGKDGDRKEARSNQHDKRRERDDRNDKRREHDDRNDKKSFAALSSLCFIARKSSDWYADSGATHHMSDQRSNFSSFKEINPGTWKVNGIGGTELFALGIGTVSIVSHLHGKTQLGEFKDVLYVPKLGTNLFSIGAATDTGIDANFSKDTVVFLKNNLEIMHGQRIGKSLYHLKVIAKNSNPESTSTCIATSEKSPFQIWHQRLAHVNRKAIQKMLKLNAVTGFDLDFNNAVHSICEGCIFGKMTRSPFPSSSTKSESVGHIIHSDIGIVSIPSPSGEHYYSISKDDYSNWTSVTLMKKKSDAAKHLIKFIQFLKTTSGNSVRIVRTDGGKEYDNIFINDFFATNGITHQITNPHTPQQNGVAERMNRTAMEAARSSLHMRSSNLTNLFKKGDRSILELWGEFLKSAIYVLNRTLSCNPSSSSSTKTPHELLFNEKPNISHLRIIGCRAYVHIPAANHRKLEPKGIPCWLVGYGDSTKGWKMWDPATRKFILSRDVTFNEDLLISDFSDDSNHHANKQTENLLFDPFLLVTEILGLVFINRHFYHIFTNNSTILCSYATNLGH